MKKFFITLSISLFLFIPNVFAAYTNYWADNFEMPTDVYNFGFNSNGVGTLYTPTYASYFDQLTGYNVVGYFSNSFGNDAYGTSYAYATNQMLLKDYVYSISTYICGTGTAPTSYLTTPMGYWNDYNSSYTYSNTIAVGLSTTATYYALNNRPNGLSYTWCRQINSIVVPNKNSTHINIRFYNSTAIASQYYDFFGSEIRPLGVYLSSLSDDITDIVANSGFATATSVAEVQRSVNQVATSVNNVDNTLNNSSVDNASSSISALQNNFATDSVISDLLLLPVSFYQNILNNINTSCSSYNIGSLFGTNIVLPCKSISDLFGNDIATLIDIGFCGIFVFTIRKKFVDIFESITSLNDRGNELE